MRTLPTNRKTAPMAQTAVAAEIHQALDVHRSFAPKIALDLKTLIDRVTDTRNLVIGQFVHPAFERNFHLLADTLGAGAADTENIGQRYFNSFLRWYIDASDSSQSWISLTLN
tara:strand:- start:2366 stop:2704 length:339 start_codon:yes stop_codon:yes gene_type:complete